MRDYTLNQVNPVFYVGLIDQYGSPVTGVTAPTVSLHKSQTGAGVVAWVKDTDFEWYELTSGEAHKGVYMLRQKDDDDINVSAVDTQGVCTMCVYDTDFETAYGEIDFEVGVRQRQLDEPVIIDHAVPDRNTIREALAAMRGHARGTRDGTTADHEIVMQPNRATELFSRRAEPSGGGPWTRLREIGDFTLELPAAAAAELDVPIPAIAHGAQPEAGTAEVDTPKITTVVQAPVSSIEAAGLTPVVTLA